MTYSIFCNSNGYGAVLYVCGRKVGELCYFESRSDAEASARFEVQRYEQGSVEL